MDCAHLQKPFYLVMDHVLRRYSRDYLLQMRLHPISLQKPKNLKQPDVVVKDKLQLHQINIHMRENLMSTEASFSNKATTYCEKQKSDALSGGFENNSQLQNGIVTNSECLKQLKKYPIADVTKYKFDTWFEDFWLTPTKNENTKQYSKLFEHDESKKLTANSTRIKNERKILPIIDPSNGKNILEDLIINSSEVKVKQPLEKSSTENISVGSDSDSTNDESCNGEPSDASDTNGDHEGVVTLTDSNSTSQESAKSSDEIPPETSPKMDDNPQLSHKMQRSIAILQDKLSLMKKEQHKMTVYRSFLNFKEQQLKDGFRVLDERRAEIASMSCSIRIRAKKLQEKECWLEAKEAYLRDLELKLKEASRDLLLDRLHEDEKTNVSEELDIKKNDALKAHDEVDDHKVEDENASTENHKIHTVKEAEDVINETDGLLCEGTSINNDNEYTKKSCPRH